MHNQTQFIPDMQPEPLSFSIDLTRLEDMMDPIPDDNPTSFSIDLTALEDSVSLISTNSPNLQSLFLNLQPFDKV